MKKINILFIIRLFIGGIFLVSGFEKLMQPQQNFLYVVQGYDFLHNRIMEHLVASIFPWVEFLMGVYLIVGLWVKITLRIILLCTMTFIIAVSQAIIRKLPLENCGCFGDLLHVPLRVILCMDIIMGIMIALLLKYVHKTSAFSLDNYFSQKDHS